MRNKVWTVDALTNRVLDSGKCQRVWTLGHCSLPPSLPAKTSVAAGLGGPPGPPSRRRGPVWRRIVQITPSPILSQLLRCSDRPQFGILEYFSHSAPLRGSKYRQAPIYPRKPRIQNYREGPCSGVSRPGSWGQVILRHQSRLRVYPSMQPWGVVSQPRSIG